VKVLETPIQGLKYIELDAWCDDRGVFTEAFVRGKWRELGIDFDLLQVNLSKSDEPGTIRGMHWQEDPAAQGKIVYAVEGTVYDAVVDVRKGSPTFGKSAGMKLFPQVNALYIPKGLAHGYQAMTRGASLMYLVDAPYSKAHERGVRYDDSDAGIRWPLSAVNVARKDLEWPSLKEIASA
jgi:dTDP-4-dehydrorhamnose 3,5-epimerase